MGNIIGRETQFTLRIFPDRAIMRPFPPRGGLTLGNSGFCPEVGGTIVDNFVINATYLQYVDDGSCRGITVISRCGERHTGLSGSGILTRLDGDTGSSAGRNPRHVERTR